MDDTSAWTTVGQADVILDNLIAERKVRLMLVVIPLGYGFANVADRIAEQFGGPLARKKIIDALTASLLDEVIPQGERAYRVNRGRDARAIAGFRWAVPRRCTSALITRIASPGSALSAALS